jgi:hypothetical protein
LPITSLSQEIENHALFHFGDNMTAHDLMFCLLVVLASVGLTHIIVRGSIMQFLHNWTKEGPDQLGFKAFLNDLITCYQCTGFHAGLFCSFALKGAEGVGIYAVILLVTFAGERLKNYVHPILRLALWGILMAASTDVLVAFLIGFASSYCSVLGSFLLDYIEGNTTFTMTAEEYEKTKANRD